MYKGQAGETSGTLPVKPLEGLLFLTVTGLSLWLLAGPYYLFALIPVIGLLLLFILGLKPEIGYYLILFLVPFSAYRGFVEGAQFLTVSKIVGFWILILLLVVKIDLSSRAAFYVVTMVIMVLATIFAKHIQRTATGRAFMAIRDNELAAEVSGIPVFRCKMLAFFIGCVFAGVAGWLWAYSQLRVNPNQFGLYDSMWYVGMLIIGGWGSTSGVFFGAVFLRLVGVAIDHASPYLADTFPSLAQYIYVSLGLILSGLIVVLFMLLEPRGLHYVWEKFNDASPCLHVFFGRRKERRNPPRDTCR